MDELDPKVEVGKLRVKVEGMDDRLVEVEGLKELVTVVRIAQARIEERQGVIMKLMLLIVTGMLGITFAVWRTGVLP